MAYCKKNILFILAADVILLNHKREGVFFLKRLSDIEELKGMGFFVKFLDSQYLDFLLDGNLFMNTLGNFIELEKKTKIRGQGDKYEGAHVFQVGEVKILDPKTNRVLGVAKTGMFQERYEGVREIPVFCFSRFTAKDFKVIEETENEVTVRLALDETETEKFLENFGDTAVVLPADFPNMIHKEALNQGNDITIGPAIYDDYTVINPTRMKAFEEQSVEIIAWKDKFFEYQREWRFAILNKPTKEPFNYSLNKSIRDEVIVMDAEYFLKNFRIKFQYR